jgi:hypothetical protein
VVIHLERRRTPTSGLTLLRMAERRRSRISVNGEHYDIASDAATVVEAIKSALGGGTARFSLDGGGDVFITPTAAGAIVVSEVTAASSDDLTTIDLTDRERKAASASEVRE